MKVATRGIAQSQGNATAISRWERSHPERGERKEMTIATVIAFGLIVIAIEIWYEANR